MQTVIFLENGMSKPTIGFIGLERMGGDHGRPLSEEMSIRANPLGGVVLLVGCRGSQVKRDSH